MTAKLLNDNGQYIHMSSYRSLIENMINDQWKINAREYFNISSNEKLGEYATLKHFGKDELNVETPKNPLNENNVDDTPSYLPNCENI